MPLTYGRRPSEKNPHGPPNIALSMYGLKLGAIVRPNNSQMANEF